MASIGGVFGHEGGRPAVLAAGGEALHHAQQDQQDGGPELDLVEGGQDADGERRDGHQHDGGGEDRLSAQPIAERSPDEPAQGAHQEGDRKGGERESVS